VARARLPEVLRGPSTPPQSAPDTLPFTTDRHSAAHGAGTGGSGSEAAQALWPQYRRWGPVATHADHGPPPGSDAATRSPRLPTALTARSTWRDATAANRAHFTQRRPALRRWRATSPKLLGCGGSRTEGGGLGGGVPFAGAQGPQQPAVWL